MAGIYVHIPFCKQKCNYCNFHFSTNRSYQGDMLQALLQEIELRKAYLGESPVIETIYFGGGTPSLLSAGDIKKITESIYKNMHSIQLKEFTLEANPDDLDSGYLQTLKQTDISRLSIGIQSFRDKDLKFMNRAHHSRQAETAVKSALDAGFNQLTVDLIYGIPGLSNQDWVNHLEKVRQWGIPHFSAYALTVEEGTVLDYAIRNKKSPPVLQEQAAAQMEILVQWAASNGYEAYEISNFCTPGNYAVHNTNYWSGKSYLGIGPSAHSFDGRSRSWNISNNALYIQSLAKGNPAIAETEALTTIQQVNEYILTSLRTQWGTDIETASRIAGRDLEPFFIRTASVHIKQAFIRLENKRLTLSDKGKLFADGIAADFFLDE